MSPPTPLGDLCRAHFQHPSGGGRHQRRLRALRRQLFLQRRRGRARRARLPERRQWARRARGGWRRGAGSQHAVLGAQAGGRHFLRQTKRPGSRHNQDYVESDDAILVDEAAGTDFALYQLPWRHDHRHVHLRGRTYLHAEFRRRLCRHGAWRGGHPRGRPAGAFGTTSRWRRTPSTARYSQAATPSLSTPSSARARRSRGIKAPSTAAASR